MKPYKYRTIKILILHLSALKLLRTKVRKFIYHLKGLQDILNTKGVSMDYNSAEEYDEKISTLSSNFIMDVENIISGYEEEVLTIQEEVEGEKDAFLDDSDDREEASQSEGYQELDGLYDSLEDILNSIKIIKDSLEDIRNYV